MDGVHRWHYLYYICFMNGSLHALYYAFNLCIVLTWCLCLCCTYGLSALDPNWEKFNPHCKWLKKLVSWVLTPLAGLLHNIMLHFLLDANRHCNVKLMGSLCHLTHGLCVSAHSVHSFHCDAIVTYCLPNCLWWSYRQLVRHQAHHIQWLGCCY